MAKKKAKKVAKKEAPVKKVAKKPVEKVQSFRVRNVILKFKKSVEVIVNGRKFSGQSISVPVEFVTAVESQVRLGYGDVQVL